MDTQLQQRAVQVTKGLSAIARSASTRIHAAQQTILKEEAKREELKKRLLEGRLSRARRGLRRFLMFASGRPIQQLVKTNERLDGKGQLLSFCEFSWNGIGMDATSRVSFSIGSQGVIVTMINTCWRTMMVSAVFPYKGSEVTVETNFAKKDCPEWKSPTKYVLNRMATGQMSSLSEIGEESEAALRVLGLWSRPAPFEKTATAFLESLERQVARKLQHELRKAE